MKLLSRRNLLIAAVLAALAANLAFQGLSGSGRTSDAAKNGESAISAEAVVPSLSGLVEMGSEWQRHINSLPPEARPAAQARLDKERAFFTKAFLQPPDQRKQQLREHFQDLMNDPEIQGLMGEARITRLIRMDPSRREKLIRDYVRQKNQAASH